ncbi:MAG TPA: helix-turn-helix domain-containing protein [Candidatus Krumholzibacteria bacterium]|nr:helix-turn-helix domain-containing protein [Candidatus Krumholzibacteria bacterium]HPD71031.1 helix-turn-helix domain-containing protein [Candidatus Krumholzibacteria bacterium]HRY39269.1 helix-turn-helix domain-containing protein [Candidatus Krumholzibacteria bacterium]
MDRELAADLAELGLTATEAEIYLALLEQSAAGPVSAYKLAQDMGRDPANMTKTLGAMAKRGAVQATRGKPRLFAAVPPADFTGALVQRLQAKQRQVVKRLETIGHPPGDESLHPLDTRQQILEVARRLLGEARRIVLVDASADLLGELAPELARAASTRSATVLVKSAARVAIPGVRVWIDPGEDALVGAAPGPWLRLAVDGRGSLEALAHPGDADQLLHGFWTRSPARAFLAHRGLAAELILADVGELLRAGASADLVSRRAADQAALLLRQVDWRQRWREAGLPDYPPAAAAAAAEGEGFQPATPGADESGGESLQFIFRKPRRP